MREKFAAGIVLAGIASSLLIAAGCSSSAQSDESSRSRSVVSSTGKDAADVGGQAAASVAGAGSEALRKAAAEGKYLFVFFFRTEEQQTGPMRQVFDAAMAKLSDRANATVVNITDPAEQGLVSKYGVARAPMPLVLAIAPNGAITGGFPSRFEEKDLLDAFATPCTQKCMKRLQEGKLVLLCIQNDKTTANAAAMQGVRDFQADPRFSGATEIVTLDPADEAEAPFLDDLQVPSDTKEAVTIFLAPPGAPIGKFEGATSKEQIVAALEKASSGCCPGGSCGPGGCGPAP